ncbi:hypothetical protein VISI1226_18736 [Vibrio sinaloensis DSM 21326]|uniref:Uncharacterized protein n=1 Tax=Vibrio sinaloensis DSM 21326 TaxID=945550 RepID=E8MCH1_PHOS4|nr:hypothetical protein [Vibrio sinaloensis]EGA68339.1 hypothetical protein VISI1226_18736 [Vibrio sinaloensis DSM 21326]
MAKRLCKMNRKQIAENLGEIHRLVVEPKFVCRSCARSASSSSNLCKPAAIPPQQCQDKPLEQQRSCGLLAEALPPATEKYAEQKAQAVRRVIDRVKQKAQQEVKPAPLEVPASLLDVSDKKAIKKAKKALKKQFKQQKKLLKLAKKQHKLLKQQKKLEARLESVSPLIVPELLDVQSQSHMH